MILYEVISISILEVDMRKVVNRRLYDTEKSREVGSWSNEYPVNDFHFCMETLHRKRTGEYFLHGEGGAMSRYAESCGQNMWRGGEAIIPLDYEAARVWAEEHLDADEYDAEFGIADEGTEHDLHAIVTEETWQALSRAATKELVTVGAIIDRLAKEL